MSWFGDTNLTPIESTSRGQFYKTASQNVTAGATPTTTIVSFPATTTWSDTGSNAGIVRTTPTTFTVQKKGLYYLDVQLAYQIGATATFGSNLHICNIRLTRAGSGSTISAVSSDFAGYSATVSTARSLQSQTMYQLDVGDIIEIQSYDFLTAGVLSIQPISVAPFNFDLNTYFSWTLLKELA